MDASEQFAFPSPQPQDPPEVREALEQAGILWSEDPKESLKWLRKAAEIASDSGDDMRSVQLARVSADLRNLANISPSIPPPNTLPPLSLPLPSAPVVVGEATEGETTSGEAASANEAASVGVLAALSEQPVDAAAVTATVPESNGAHLWSSAENTVRDQNAIGQEPDQQITPNAPPVAGAAGDAGAVSPPGAPPPEAMVAIPQVSFSKDPAQTVPATPAASAAALALATAPASYQSVPPSHSAGYGVAPSAAAPIGATQSAGAAPGAVANHGSIAGALAAKRPAAGFFGNPGGGAAGPRPEQPTLVGRPLTNTNGPRGVNDETPAATPAAIQADSVAPGSNTRFVQHRAVEVAISIAPNASGHFDLHPLAEGENLEPGFRRALLVALGADDRLFPGRG